MHNNTKITHAYLSCIFKDSRCNTLLPKILELTILFTSEISYSTKVSTFPYTKNDSIFIHVDLLT